MSKELVVTVFGSSRPREGDADYEDARILGRALAKHGFSICNGGYGGGVGAVSRGAEETGGRNHRVAAAVFKTAQPKAWNDVGGWGKNWGEGVFELSRGG